MRGWALLLGGLVVWAAHFFLAYGFASTFPGSDMVRWLTLAATAAALVANAVIIRFALAQQGSADVLGQWKARVGGAGAALSFVAVAWQGLPALF